MNFPPLLSLDETSIVRTTVCREDSLQATLAVGIYMYIATCMWQTYLTAACYRHLLNGHLHKRGPYKQCKIQSNNSSCAWNMLKIYIVQNCAHSSVIISHSSCYVHSSPWKMVIKHQMVYTLHVI